jgi:hypothetical protein
LDSEEEEEEEEVGVIYSDVVIRPPTRPTMESWANSGWRVGREKKTPAKRKRKKRRLNDALDVGHENSLVSQNNNNNCKTGQYSDAYFEALPALTETRPGDVIAYKTMEVSARWVCSLFLSFFSIVRCYSCFFH